MPAKDTILTIDVVEPALVEAVKKHAREMGRQLKGLVLVNTDFANKPDRPRDTTGLFKEIICDFYNPNELQSILKPYCDRLLAVTCRLESAIPAFRQAIPFLPHVATPSESSLLWSSEKPLMRERLSNFDQSLTPKYQLVEPQDVVHIRELVGDFEFPVIVKPSSLAKSLLVSKCQTIEELEVCLKETFEMITKVYLQERRRSKPSVLVEEMMQGEMYSTDAYATQNGQIFCLPLVKVVAADSIGLPGFYGFRIITPTGLPKREVAAAFRAAKSAIRALNLSVSTAHVELFRTGAGWKIIELGARIGGYRQAVYKEAFDIDHFYNDLAIRMGKRPKMPGKAIRHATALNIYAEQEGIIESIGGLVAARKLPSVLSVEKHAKPGDKALFATNGGELIVDAVLSNGDIEQLEKDVAKVRQLVKIKIRSGRFTADPKPKIALAQETLV